MIVNLPVTSEKCHRTALWKATHSPDGSTICSTWAWRRHWVFGGGLL